MSYHFPFDESTTNIGIPILLVWCKDVCLSIRLRWVFERYSVKDKILISTIYAAEK